MPCQQSAYHQSERGGRAESPREQADGKPITRKQVPDDPLERSGTAARYYEQFVNPHVSDLLERLCMDKCFVRGEGHLLFDAEGNGYLDAVSGYGAAPFGHNPDWIWQAVMEFAQTREPS